MDLSVEVTEQPNDPARMALKFGVTLDFWFISFDYFKYYSYNRGKLQSNKTSNNTTVPKAVKYPTFYWNTRDKPIRHQKLNQINQSIGKNQH